MIEIKARILSVMAAIFGINVSDIPENATPQVVEEWDSLKQINLVFALEDEFNIYFPDEVTEQLLSIESIEMVVNRLLQKHN